MAESKIDVQAKPKIILLVDPKNNVHIKQAMTAPLIWPTSLMILDQHAEWIFAQFTIHNSMFANL